MDNSDFVFTQATDENGNKVIIGGGYKINSYFLKEGNPIMTTINNENDINNLQNGGKKISSPFENLAVPAGIFYINQKIPKISSIETHYNENHNMLSEDIHDKLLSLVQPITKKKYTRKNNIINDNIKNNLANDDNLKKINNKRSKKTRKNK